jgi:hypothetical protein
MADNLTIKDGANASATLRTTDSAGVHTPHHIVDSAPGLTFLGDQAITPNGAAVSATLPAGTNTVYLYAENATIRYRINDTAGATSPNIPTDDQRVIFKLTNLTSLSVYAAAGTGIAHLLYFEEA